MRDHGYYFNAARGKRRRGQDSCVARADAELEQQALPSPAAAALRKRWADLLFVDDLGLLASVRRHAPDA